MRSIGRGTRPREHRGRAPVPAEEVVSLADVLIYGGEPGGVAAALAVARHSDPGTEVVLCFPERMAGGTCTSGGLTEWDRRLWMRAGRRADPQGGSFARWLERYGAHFSSSNFARGLTEELCQAGVTVLAGVDIEAVATAGRPTRPRRTKQPSPPTTVHAVRLRRLADQNGETTWSDETMELSAHLFVDASTTGRLARLAGLPAAVGREDWNPDRRQMAASLLFAVQGIDWDALASARDDTGRPVWGTGQDGAHRLFWGGQSVVTSDGGIAAFHTTHPHFRLGSIRAVETESDWFWLQGLLIFGVDGRMRRYDEGSPSEVELYPANALHVDSGLAAAREIVASPDLLGALRQLPGWSTVQIGRDAHDEVISAESLYLRETIHTRGPSGFAVTGDDVSGAGSSPAEGKDARHYSRRIGLGFYWMENVGYMGHENVPTPGAATNPCYLPLDVLLAPPVENLLLPGYAASVDSRAWWSMRAQPNLCVLGDAAGVTAALALHEGKSPLQFGNSQVAALQSWLQGEGAILEKW